jgi:hypothetical protein
VAISFTDRTTEVIAVRRLLVVVLLLLLWAPVARAWTWPVRGPVVQGFSFDREHPYAAGQRRGIDIGSSGGVPVLAPASGTVTFAGSVPGNGTCVTIETVYGLAVTLTHLGSVSVGKGAVVGEGATVGTVGTAATSDVGGPFVHLGIRVTSDPNGYLDPLTLLPPATNVGNPSSTPAPSPAPATQQSSAGSTSQFVAGAAATTVSSGTMLTAASGPPATGASTPVEVPSTDFARHAVSASPKPASAKVARVASMTSAAGSRARPAAVAAVLPARGGRAVHVGTRGRVLTHRHAHPRATRSTTSTAAPAVARFSRAVDVVEDAYPGATLRPAQAASTPTVAHSRASAARRRPTSRAPFAGGALVALLLLLGALFRCRRGVPVAPPQEEAVVVALPLSLRREPVSEGQRLAA